MKRNRLLSMLLATVLVLTLLAGCGSEPAPAATPEPAAPASEAPAAEPAAPAEEPAAEKFVVLNSTKGMDNQYYVELDRGGKEAAAQLGMEYVTLSAENNEQKQVADLESGLVTYQPDLVIIMPMSPSIVPALCDLCENAKVPFITLFDYPEGMDFTAYEYHLAHLLTDLYQEGKTEAEYLFEAMGGEGGIIAIDGPAGNTTAVRRHEGLLDAMKEYPGITLLESQPGDFDRFAAAPVFEDMYIKYGDQIDGVWCANDDMAMGVIEILDGVGKLGQVKISGLDCLQDFLDHMKKGNTCVSLSGDAPGMQARAVCFGYDYLTEGIRPVTDENKHAIWDPPVVTPENVDEYYDLWYGSKAAGRDWTADSKVKHPA
ncbi:MULTISPECIES: sugar ABC transporter substrate-binding protein [Anaerotruncus]|uniref:Sugar ABC transporter substrate-binding protein n=2 Tax=Anaerotruncus TaxID=244127 RepID=A0A498CTE9_9FIRM|nr:MULTISPECIES: sugar ABC transporter substrate-binding protein [Anaerotruncus]MBC3937767.1 sugar ABC transporter substrate-binding protein [Anaerotruncus massiliensis (ex Togo et al. 2019)]RLL13768.1 sugar ABC transporter substrate-binding protein [Anaerotruncus massiliensis (ex Liu et al. 2021)]GKH46382.1 sugar ABC transporter substrate-binding protein [Oscillospiraceae bacterium]